MINRALVTGKASDVKLLSKPRVPRLSVASMLLAMLLLTGCNNSLDLRSSHLEPAEQQAQASMQSTQTSALSLTEAASAARYINTQDMMQAARAEQPAHAPVGSDSRLKQFAGRYTGQVPCVIQSATCSGGQIDMTLTLLPDGSAIRTLAAQGKINAMLDKETANWTVSANGQNIMLMLPNREIWSFRKVDGNQLQFQPASSTVPELAQAATPYSLTASHS